MDPHLAWFILVNPLTCHGADHWLQVCRRERCPLGFLFGFIAAPESGSPGLRCASEVPLVDFGPAPGPIGLLIDLSRLILVVTGIGALIHIYSTVYMERDGSTTVFREPVTFHVFDVKYCPRG
jgi:NADH-quinone oxidoreductase subunit L